MIAGLVSVFLAASAGAATLESAFPQALKLVQAAPIASAKPKLALVVFCTRSAGAEDSFIRWGARAELGELAHPKERRRMRQACWADELGKLLAEAALEGFEVDRLILWSHGTPGASEIISSWSIPNLANYPAAFAAGARVEFRSCDTGRGLSGVRFMEKLGAIWLSARGGSITAARGLHYSTGRLGIKGSPDGWQTYVVSPGGAGAFSHPIDAAKARRVVEKRLDQLERHIGMPGDWRPGGSQDDLRRFESAISSARAALGWGDESGIMRAETETRRAEKSFNDLMPAGWPGTGM